MLWLQSRRHVLTSYIYLWCYIQCDLLCRSVLSVLFICLLVFNETPENDSHLPDRRCSSYWLTGVEKRHNYRSELWILINSHVAHTLWNNWSLMFSCPYAADMSWGFFYSCSGRPTAGRRHALVLWQVYFLFLVHSCLHAALSSCLCFRRSVLGVPRIVYMFNSCRSSCINQTVFFRFTPLPLPLPSRLPAGTEARTENENERGQFDPRPASNQTACEILK